MMPDRVSLDRWKESKKEKKKCQYFCPQRKFHLNFPGVQWLRICLSMQGHRFNPWSTEIPCATATKLASQLLSLSALESVFHNKKTSAKRNSQTATKSSPHSLELGKVHMQQ